MINYLNLSHDIFLAMGGNKKDGQTTYAMLLKLGPRGIDTRRITPKGIFLAGEVLSH
jgi:hypothetical protein